MANDTQFNYRDATGRARTAKSSAAVPGQAGYESAALSPDGTRTAQGDAANPFRGYRSADGGSFGGYDTAIDPRNGLTQKQYDERVAAGRKTLRPIDWSRTTAASRENVGGRGLSQSETNARLAGTDELQRRIAENGDTNFTDDELAQLQESTGTTENPFRSKADMVRLGYDTKGNKVSEGADYYERGVLAGAWSPESAAQARAKFAAAQPDPNAPAAPEALEAPVNADPFGRFEAPTAANSVIKPGQDRLSPRTPRMQQPDPFDLFQPGITPAQNPGAQAGIQATPAAIQPATFGAQQQSALGSPDQLGPTDTNPAGLPTRPPSDATPNGVSFVPGGIQPMTFGRREIPWATPNAGPPAGLPAAPAMTQPAGGFGGAFGSPMKGGMGAGLRRIGQRLMPGLKRPRALRPIRPQGGAAQTGLTPQTPQF